MRMHLRQLVQRNTDPAARRARAELLSHERDLLLSRRLRFFSYAVIAMTLVLVVVLLSSCLFTVVADLLVIWVVGFWVLSGLRVVFGKLSQETLSGLKMVELRSVSGVFCGAVAGFAAVAGSFGIAGVPFASGIVLVVSLVSTALVLLAGAP
ncbi:hypothetical protein [Bosea sp. MMO-172]|uniref:hypothetical protein n=1 Tax=Bosea sp. MMO-172 TaxID=3127885 RepID=UPI003018C2D8